MADADTYAVKISLREEMYPRFNFLRRRLFSIHPRFKAAIEKESLFDLIPSGKELLDKIELAQVKLKESVHLYLKGCYADISQDQILSNFIVSSKGKDEFKMTKVFLRESEFKEAIKNIDGYPSVIVHGIQSENSSTESFQSTAQSLVSFLPPRDRMSCIIGSRNCKKYGFLEDININGSFSEVDSMGKLIQSCLEDKVVRVLKMMADYIQLFFPLVQPEYTGEQEPLQLTIKKSLQKSIHESNLNQEKQEQRNRRDFGSAMTWYICRNLEIQICERQSLQYGIRRSVAHEFLCKMKFDDKMKEKVEENPEIFRKGTDEIALYFDSFAEHISDDLAHFEEQARKTYQIISVVLTKMLFEIRGVFKQAKLPVDSVAQTQIYKELKTKILSTEGVFACGFVFDKLIVHVEEDSSCTDDEIADKIRTYMRQIYRKDLMNKFEVQRICCSRNAGITYESGKSLRVEKVPTQINAGDSVADDNHSYGTLGCFVNGKAHETGGGSYSSQLYALSCAHVFPKGCENIVEVGRTDMKFDTFGIVSQELTLSKGNKVDIAAVVVDASVMQKCNVKLKNCAGFDGWESSLHEGDLGDLIGTEVYKWGCMSDLTQGIIVSIDYEIHGTESLDEEYNILIEALPESSVTDFSIKGDSGSLLCFEDPVEEKVIALSMISGALYSYTDNKFLNTYSCHLHINIQELSRKTKINFEWCN